MERSVRSLCSPRGLAFLLSSTTSPLIDMQDLSRTSDIEVASCNTRLRHLANVGQFCLRATTVVALLLSLSAELYILTYELRLCSTKYAVDSVDGHGDGVASRFRFGGLASIDGQAKFGFVLQHLISCESPSPSSEASPRVLK